MNIKVLQRYMKYCKIKDHEPNATELKQFNYMVKAEGITCK